MFKFAELLISRHIPFACIFGNHDDEGSLNRAATAELLSTLPYSLTMHGPSTVPGVGNYYVEVLSHSTHHSALTLYFLDTHSYSPDENKFKGYDWVKPEQIAWFKNSAAALSEDHTKYSHIHLDMAFIHIPLPEYVTKGITVGEFREGVTAPHYNSGFRDALVEMGVSVASCGHDHANDYCLLSDKQGTPATKRGASDPEAAAEPNGAKSHADVHKPSADQPEDAAPIVKHPRPRDSKLWLCYAGGSGFGGYGGYNGYVRRVRVFEFDANEARITTWKKAEYIADSEDSGKKGKASHEKGLKTALTKKIDEQIIVDRGRVVAKAG